ncbi:hypothetical protein HDU96_000079 [Phlyctochytrium bullatum]|nr:hypothetical protein HDU96_000079 [Phlyctochytrium bullatum]
MSLTTLTREGPLFILKLHNGDNRFSPDFIDSLNKRLDEIEEAVEKEGLSEAALVTVIDPKDKIFSNGLKLEAIALSGHAFAGGCMWSLTHDYRVMRTDRGFICMNEVDMPANLTPGMMAIIRNKVVHPAAFRDMIMLGRRFNAEEAFQYGFVDLTAPNPEETIKTAKQLGLKVAPKAAAGKTYGTLKEEMYRETAGFLRSKDLGHVEAIFAAKL